MKQTLTSCVALLLVMSISAATDTMQPSNNDEAAIRQACLDYFEGWYEGSVARMERALSPELAKRTVGRTQNGREYLQYSPYLAMVEWTRSGGTKAPVAEQNIEVKIFDIKDNIASAVITSNQYYDYVHVAKVNGEWKIINVLWTSNKAAK